jgi:hypothetical protein
MPWTCAFRVAGGSRNSWQSEDWDAEMIKPVEP